MTFNIHQLLHLAQSVANWGPLWSHWGYPFEAGNGQLLKAAHASKGVLHQLCCFVTGDFSMRILQKHNIQKEDSAMNDFIYYLENRCTKKTVKVDGNRYFGKRKVIDENTAFEHQLPAGIIWSFKSYLEIIAYSNQGRAGHMNHYM